LDNVLSDSLTDSTDIAFDFVNEIVNSSFESGQKPTAHSGSLVNKSSFEKWTEKCPWLIVTMSKNKQLPAVIYARSRETH